VKNIQKTFITGDKWLYYKIYCGVKTADMVLTEIIKPLTEELIEEKLIDQWFFIRYSDPEPHIRVRFHLKDLETLGSILIKIKKLLIPYIDSRQIWDMQLATYQREIERYGDSTIEDAESFFYYDSVQVLKIIETTENDELRFLKLFKWLETILHLFKLEDKKVLSFLERMQQQFKEEFNATKTVRKELSNTYRKLELQLHDSSSFNFQNKEILSKIVRKFLKLEKEKSLHVSTENLLASCIHMSVNRCFRSKQRLYEMMLYDFLYRKNKSNFIRYGCK
jgi:thiopeptide-type bacteriocin biosynthesis protein